MYIACPSCSTSFSVDGVNIGTDGRAVRCFNCSHTWHQYPMVHQPQAHYVPVQYVSPSQFAAAPQPAPQVAAPPVPEPITEPAPAPLPEPEPEPAPLPEPEPAPEEELPSDDELDAMLGPVEDDDESAASEEVEEAEEISLEDLEELEDPEPLEPFVPNAADDEDEIDPDDIPDPEPLEAGIYDPEDEELEEKGSLIGTLIKVLVMLVVIGGLGAGAVVMRGIVVDLIPASNIVFELIGLRVPVPGEGLKIQSGDPQREERGGKEVIVIKGSITNVSDVEQPVPEIIVRAIDAEEQVVQIHILKPEKLTLAPGKSQKFTGIFKNLVATARRLEVGYGAFVSEEAPAAGAAKDDGHK